MLSIPRTTFPVWYMFFYVWFLHVITRIPEMNGEARSHSPWQGSLLKCVICLIIDDDAIRCQAMIEHCLWCRDMICVQNSVMKVPIIMYCLHKISMQQKSTSEETLGVN